jgi:hypothetical protein
LELDRNTEFVDPMAVMIKHPLPDNQSDASGLVVQRRDPLEELMRSMITSFPIIRAHGKHDVNVFALYPGNSSLICGY